MRKYRARTEVQGTVGKYRARWESTGHGEEVQCSVRAQWESKGHGEEVQVTVEKHRAW